MFSHLCEYKSDTINELCILETRITWILLLIIFILISGFTHLYIYRTTKRENSLLHFHHIRSFLLFIGFIVNIIDLADTIVGQYPPNGFNKVASIAVTNATLSLLTTIFLSIFIHNIELREAAGYLFIVLIVNGLQVITRVVMFYKITELPQMKYDYLSYVQSNLLCISISIYLGLILIESFTLYRQATTGRSGRTYGSNSTSNVSYSHSTVKFLSKLTFSSLIPLLRKGYNNPLEIEDLGNLYEEDTARYHYDRFLLIYKNCKKTNQSLWMCYIKGSWKMFIFGGLLKFFGDLMALVGPLAISHIVLYIENCNSTLNGIQNGTTVREINYINETVYDYLDENRIYYTTINEFISNGWIMALIVLIASLTQGSLSQLSTHIANMIGIQLKTSIQALVYRKTLFISNSCVNNCKKSSIDKRDYETINVNINRFDGKQTDDNSKMMNQNKIDENLNKYKGPLIDSNDSMKQTKSYDAGTITNFMTEDAFNVMQFFWIAHYVWAIPLKVGIVMYLLYLKLGISAIIGSLTCIITLIPLQFLIGKLMSTNTKLAAKWTDERLKQTSEVLMGIKLIKLNAWESVFRDKIQEIRSNELKYLNIDSIYWTLMTLLTHISSVFVTFVTLAVFMRIEGNSSNGSNESTNDNDDIGMFTANSVFSALALFNQLTVPLFIFPITIPIIISAIVSTKRLERFLSQPEVEKEFEGIRNMAQILSRSDASLDLDETNGTSDDIPSYCESDCNTDTLRSIASNIPSVTDDDSLLKINDCTMKNNNGENVEIFHSLNEIFNEIGNEHNSSGSDRTETLKSVAKSIKLRKNNKISSQTLLERNRGRTRCSSIKELHLTMPDDLIVRVRDGTFVWDTIELSKLVISSLDIPKGKLTIIVGKSGAGKSSLLAALLMEMRCTSGKLLWNKYSTIAYVAQQPWLLNATIRDNILFGEPYRPKRYNKILDACALKPDIDLMPDNDMTKIGERGINFSGGQRQRIAIARALYSSANVILMDDPLSALDNEVAKWVFDNCIKNMLLKQRRSVVFVTQKLSLIEYADYIVAMEQGHVRVAGTLVDIESKDRDLVNEWNLIIAKETETSVQLCSGRTARERWRLFKNISKLGFQRGSILGSEDDFIDNCDTIPLPINRKRTNLFGSCHLSYDMPFPIDEYQTDEGPLRRLPSMKKRLLDPINSHKRLLRTSSLKPFKSRPGRSTVVRNISSPTTFQSFRLRSTEAVNHGFRRFFNRMSSRNSNATIKLTRSMQRTSIDHSIDSTSDRDPIKKTVSIVSQCSADNEELTPNECENCDDDKDNNQYEYDEERKYGEIPSRIYLLYLKSCGFYLVTICILSAIGLQAFRMLTDVWLRNWTDSDVESMETEQVYNYFIIYGILSGVSIIFAMISTPVGQMAGCRARKILHTYLLNAVIRQSLYYFQITPVGRILNRFSSDMAVIDKKIAATSQRLLQFVLLCLFAVLINTAITPWFILITLPICLAYYFVQRFYRNSSRELQRIESITSSPIISHFTETILGVTTIRAYHQESRFMETLFKRLETNNVAFIILNTSNRWLGIALDYLGGFIVFIAIVTALLTAHLKPDAISSSLVGLAINYTLLVPIYLNWVVKLLSDMEMYIGAVERIEHYFTSENMLPKHRKLYKSVPISWPQYGNISFENVTLKYEAQKTFVFKHLSLSIPAGQRIGICGRTGSGKSSLALSLFGVLELVEGRILIDDIDISTIHTDEIRSRFSIIPQDVILFSGTIRANLDPRGHYSDLELWNCIEMAQLKDSITALPDGLDSQIIENGMNFSVGQKQLFCLARAILRGSVCLVLDEATSSLDHGTESLLLDAASRAFHGRTIITIAHRLSTLINYDRIILIENGKIVEDGNPVELKSMKDSKFAALLNTTQNDFT